MKLRIDVLVARILVGLLWVFALGTIVFMFWQFIRWRTIAFFLGLALFIWALVTASDPLHRKDD